MSGQLKKIIAYVVSIALGLFLLYLALQDVDIDELKTSFAEVNFLWVIPVVGLILLSHAIRAWRWQLLVDALPDRQRTGELGKSSFKNVFLALFIGYFANILIPRIGEVARATSLSKKEGIRFSGVFGTVIAERVFDTVVLGLGVASLCLLFYDQFLFIRDSIFYPVMSLGEKIPVLWAALSLAGVTALGYVTVRTIKTSQSSRMMQFRRRLMSILNSFKDGAFTLLRVPRRTALLTSTALMWFCYVLMAFVTFIMLDMHNSHGLGMSAAWSIMIFGAIGFELISIKASRSIIRSKPHIALTIL